MGINQRVRDRLTMAGYHVDENGVITRPPQEYRRMIQAFIHVKPEPRFNCSMWHQLLFDTVFGQEYVPSPCFDCYKVVVTLRTVEELFEAYETLKRMNLPSKCGLDGNRQNTDKLYAAYFYNKGIKEGMKRFDLVADAFPGNKVILKRACTEFEQACGPSDQWEVGKEQQRIEAEFFGHFTWAVEDQMQTPVQVAAIKQEWINKAYQWGDTTYLKFTGGEPLYPPLVTYKEN